MAEMVARYLEHMGSDLSICRAARNSFAKEQEGWRGEKDERLLNYLARERHELPFAHPHISFHFEAPIFVARQLAKHQVGFVWSEVSRRYVKTEPTFWWPKVWRKGSKDIKQGSLDESVEDVNRYFAKYMQFSAEDSLEAYNYALERGVCAEQARMVLPQNMMTAWTWTGSLLGWSRIWKLRTAADAQRETAEVVRQIDGPLAELFPVAWGVLKKHGSAVEEPAGA